MKLTKAHNALLTMLESESGGMHFVKFKPHEWELLDDIIETHAAFIDISGSQYLVSAAGRAYLEEPGKKET